MVDEEQGGKMEALVRKLIRLTHVGHIRWAPADYKGEALHGYTATHLDRILTIRRDDSIPRLPRYVHGRLVYINDPSRYSLTISKASDGSNIFLRGTESIADLFEVIDRAASGFDDWANDVLADEDEPTN